MTLETLTNIANWLELRYPGIAVQVELPAMLILQYHENTCAIEAYTPNYMLEQAKKWYDSLDLYPDTPKLFAGYSDRLSAK